MAKRKRQQLVERQAPPLSSEEPAKAPFLPLTAIVLFILIALFAMLRLRLLDLPLERDEGEYAYAGQLILDGIPPYKLVYNMKWPGTYAAYAAIMGIFGETIPGIRIGLILVTSATALCLYFLTRRLFGRVAGIVAAAAELVLSITIAAMGPYAHATHFVSLAAVAGLMLLMPRNENDRVTLARVIGAGALLAVAALMKQPGMFFGLLAAAWLLSMKRFRETGALAGGASIAMGVSVAILAIAGVFDRFKFWTIDYARQYVSQNTVAQGMEELKANFGGIFHYTPLMWWIALAGLVLLFVDAEARKHWKFVVAFTIAGVLATMPGLYFRPHYFIVLFPAIAMLNGIAVAAASRLVPWRSVPVIAYALAFVITVGQQWSTLVGMDSMTITRALYGDNPFPEAIEIASYIKEHTTLDDRIAVLGSEPEIYFYSGRKSATGYIYTYALMEKQKFARHMQDEMIAEIERAKPKYLVTVSVAMSWLVREESDKTIFDWSEKYASSQYLLEGIAEILPSGTQYAWGEDARRYQPKTRSLVMVFRRR